MSCVELTFLQKHESFILTIVGFLSAGGGMILNYFIRSRCTDIKCLCISCKRTPIELNNNNVEIISNK